MIKILIEILIIFILAIIQISFLPIINFFGIWPNLFLIFVTILLVFKLEERALMLALVGGLALDLANTTMFGFNTIFLLLEILIIKFVWEKIFSETNWLLTSLLSGFVSVIYSLSILIFNHQFLGWTLLIDFIYSAFIAAIIFQFFNKYVKEGSIIKL